MHIDRFERFIGIPFVNGGRDYAGCDCWGLVKMIFKEEFDTDLPDYKISCNDYSKIDGKIAEEKSKWIKHSTPQLPSLVVMYFNSPKLCNHCGVYIGDGKFIHIATKMHSYRDDVEQPYWKRKIEGFYTLRKEDSSC